MLKYIIFTISITIFLINASDAFAQNIQTYDSTYTINDRTFLAKYEYYISEGDTIYNGKFKLSQQFENQDDIYEYLAIEGGFIENRADEKWKLTEGSFEPTGKGYYKDYTYSYDVNGHEFMAMGKFMAGNKTGAWNLYDWQIRESVITDTTLIAEINYEDNNAKGNFSLKIENSVLEGKLGEDELAEGTWAFYRIINPQTKVLVKEWVFKDQLFVGQKLYRNNETIEIKIEAPAKDSLSIETIIVDEDFLKIKELKGRIYNEKLLEEYSQEDKVSNLFFSLLSNLRLVDEKFLPITKTGITPTISTKLRSSQLSEKEIALLEAIKNQVKINSDKAQLILQNPQINIASIAEKDITTLKRVTEIILQEFIVPSQEIISLYDKDQLKFFNRNKLIQYKLNLLNEKSIENVLNKDSLTSEYQIETDLSFLNNDGIELLKFSKFSKAIEEELELIDKNLSKYLNEVQKEEKLVEMEEALLAKYERTKYLADSLITGEHDNFAGIDVAGAIIDFADAELAVYSNLPSPEEKIQAIEPLINCFSHAEELIYTIQKAPESIYKINDAYTKEVFNPYTFTNMEEKSKAPIYKAFNKLLLPGIFQNMQKLNCNNMRAFQANFKILYDEMIEVLNEDNTNRMERKVKRAKTAEKAAEILNMELSF
jgi:hypothetical protein